MVDDTNDVIITCTTGVLSSVQFCL